MMRKIVLSLFALSALASGATAADLPSQKAPAAPPPADVANWAGVYGGLQLGGAFGETSFALPASPYHRNLVNNGVFGGGHFGYNFQHGALVIGAEGEFNAQSDKGSFVDGNKFAPNILGASAYHDWFGSVDARLGYAVQKYLIYGVGGYAFTDNSFSVASNALQLGHDGKTLNGYDIGAGVEYAFTDKWSARLEYRYYDFAKRTSTYTNTATVFSERPYNSTVRAGLTYHWGAVEAAVAPAVVKP